jgi:hypothetical protein
MVNTFEIAETVFENHFMHASGANLLAPAALVAGGTPAVPVKALLPDPTFQTPEQLKASFPLA